MKIIGVISDTHGLLRAEAIAALEGVEAIVHAGDIGKPEVLDALHEIAPVTVVRGNVDHWATDLPDTETLTMAGYRLYVLHNLNELEIDPLADGFDVVISGHSHKPLLSSRDGVIYLNPGSAGPRRFSLPVALAKLRLSTDGVEAEIIELPV